MSGILFFAGAFWAGILLAAQSGINAQIGNILTNPVFAAGVAFLISALLALTYIVLSKNGFPTLKTLSSVPIYLWFFSGTLSFAALITYYYAIPKIGIESVISFGLAGQLVFSLIAGHFGLFGLSQDPINAQKIMGAFAMLIAIVLINFNLKDMFLS